MARQFVLHAHRGYGPLHYDLMVEHGQALATWQLAHSPLELLAGQAMPARRLQDHRREYLNYQGPVSKGRGAVERIDVGACRILSAGPDHWQIDLQGDRLAGRFELFRSGPGEEDWTLRSLRAGQDPQACPRA